MAGQLLRPVQAVIDTPEAAASAARNACQTMKLMAQAVRRGKARPDKYGRLFAKELDVVIAACRALQGWLEPEDGGF
jgi:hypothetical protein